ncbi:hypothetical protein HYV71_04260 [Candidatus Uhrbacteria bacterium]|nr:hypothetical protein [Candidatus Uhrbacteria bacterium]
MATIQDTFFRIQDTKKKQREIRSLYREALKKSHSYQEVLTDMQTLREKKKRIEENIRTEYARDLEQLDALVAELKEDHSKLADMVLSSLMRGEIIKVRDTHNTVYNPIVKVAFKKSDEQER